jgi:hypothetical protein
MGVEKEMEDEHVWNLNGNGNENSLRGGLKCSENYRSEKCEGATLLQSFESFIFIFHAIADRDGLLGS